MVSSTTHAGCGAADKVVISDFEVVRLEYHQQFKLLKCLSMFVTIKFWIRNWHPNTESIRFIAVECQALQ